MSNFTMSKIAKSYYIEIILKNNYGRSIHQKILFTKPN